MEITKNGLRAASRSVLESRGYHVEFSPGRGVALGARLRIQKSGEPAIEVAVRTSLKREVSLLRSSSGAWRTIDKVKLVVVAVPARDEPSSIDVMAFTAELLIAEFNAFAELKERDNRDPGRFKAAVFLSLDRTFYDDVKSHRCLAEKAIWTTTITNDQFAEHENTHDVSALITEIKRKIAADTGIDERKISVEIRIVE